MARTKGKERAKKKDKKEKKRPKRKEEGNTTPIRFHKVQSSSKFELLTTESSSSDEDLSSDGDARSMAKQSNIQSSVLFVLNSTFHV